MQDIEKTELMSASEIKNKSEEDSDDSDSDECDNEDEFKNSEEKINKKIFSSEAPFNYKKDDL